MSGDGVCQGITGVCQGGHGNRAVGCGNPDRDIISVTGFAVKTDETQGADQHSGDRDIKCVAPSQAGDQTTNAHVHQAI